MLDVTTHRLPLSVRLDTDAWQRTFRLLLDAFCRPGRIVELSTLADEFDVEPVLLPLLALADLDTPAAIVDTPERTAAIARLVTRSTGAPIVDDLGAAHLVLANGRITAEQIACLRRGDEWQPELGARLAVRCDHLSETEGRTQIELTGPGASRGRTIHVDGLAPGVLERLRLANAEHPAGVDTWLVDEVGRCVGIPRSSHIEIANGAH